MAASVDDVGAIAAGAFDHQLHFFDPARPDLVAQYLLAVDALNFCFWPDGELEYEHLAGGLRAALLQDPAALDAQRLATVDGPALRRLLRWPRPLPLEEERARLLREVGARLAGSCLPTAWGGRGCTNAPAYSRPRAASCPPLSGWCRPAAPVQRPGRRAGAGGGRVSGGAGAAGGRRLPGLPRPLRVGVRGACAHSGNRQRPPSPCTSAMLAWRGAPVRPRFHAHPHINTHNLLNPPPPPPPAAGASCSSTSAPRYLRGTCTAALAAAAWAPLPTSTSSPCLPTTACPWC
jgi:hypothetical protein